MSHPGARLRRRSQDAAATEEELLLDQTYQSFAGELASEDDDEATG